MDTIDRATMENAAFAIAMLNKDELGDVHTVTLTLDGRTGGCLVKVESTLSGDLEFVVR